jgi:hypothetical protein
MTVCRNTHNFQHELTYVSKADDSFIDDAYTEQGHITSATLATHSHDGLPMDSHLTAVINRWDAPAAVDEDFENEDFGNEDIDSLTDRLSRLPTITDPEMWRVRVQVSL